MKPTRFQKLAAELVEVKKSIIKMQQLEKSLKNKLMPFIGVDEVLNLPDAEISCKEIKARKSWQRKNVLKFLQKHYGKEIADEVDYNCTMITPVSRSLYVKLKNKA